jgi:RNA polymerase sigma-70 factor (ECF subfamily)
MELNRPIILFVDREHRYTPADLRAGNPDAWRSFVAESAIPVKSAVRRVAGSTQDPDDIRQVAYLRMVRSGIKDGNPVAYASVVARHAAIDAGRQRIQYMPFGEGEEERIVSTAPGVEEEALGAVNHQVFHTALEQVGLENPDQREVLILLAQGYKDGEIAAELGVKLSTVRTRIHRARTTLRNSASKESLAAALGILETK